MISARPAQVTAYNAVRPVYPLCGFVKVGETMCAVERCGFDRDNPQYEVMAPRGFHFDADETHTLLCFSLSDLDQRTRMNALVPCTKFCEE